MFTGIIESLGLVKKVIQEDSNLHLVVESPISALLKIDQSIAHNGICLTVVAVEGDTHTVTAIDETIKKTNLGTWKVGSKLNLERCMQMNGRLDGHIVQGHVDQIGKVVNIQNADGSWIYTVAYEGNAVTVEKGSITINGTSLTVVDSTSNSFSVHIIPYTYEHTNFHTLQVGDQVNLEFDIIGKYVAKLMGK